MIDLFKSSVKSILFGAGVLGCAHAALTTDDIVNLLNLQNPGIGGAPNVPPPPNIAGVGNVPFPKLKKIIESNTSRGNEREELFNLLRLIDKMYNFPGATFSMGGKNYPYTNSKDVEYIKSIEDKNESDPTIHELAKSRKNLEDLINGISLSKMPHSVDVGTVMNFFDDQGKGPLAFLYKLNDPLMPEEIGRGINRIIDKIKQGEDKYREAVLKYNQDIKERNDLKNLRPYNLNVSEHTLLNKVKELENIVAVTDRKNIEGVLAKFFGKLSMLNKEQSVAYEETNKRVTELQEQKRKIDAQIKSFYTVTNPMEGMSNSQKLIYELQHQAEIKEYQARKKQEQEALENRTDFKDLTSKLQFLTEDIAECNRTLDVFKKQIVGKSEVYKEIRTLGEKYPLNYSKAVATILNQPVQDIKIEEPTISEDAPSSSATKPEAKPEAKKAPAKPKSHPLGKSVATTKTEKADVEVDVKAMLNKTEPKKKELTEEERLKQENVDLRRQLADKMRENSGKISSIREELARDYQKANMGYMIELEKSQKTLNEIKNQLQLKDETIERLKRQLGELQNRNAGALKNNENNNNNAALENLEKLNNALKDRNSALERDLAAERAKNANSEQNTKEVVKERIVRRGGTTTVIEDTERIDALTKDIEARNAQLSQQQSALDSKDAQIRQLQQRNQQLQNQLNAQEDNKQSPASNEPSVNEDNLKLQRQQLEEMAAELENKQNELKDREAEVSKREQTVNQMQQTTNNVLQMLNRQNNEASQNVNAGQNEATKKGDVEMMPQQVKLGA